MYKSTALTCCRRRRCRCLLPLATVPRSLTLVIRSRFVSATGTNRENQLVSHRELIVWLLYSGVINFISGNCALTVFFCTHVYIGYYKLIRGVLCVRAVVLEF